MSHIYDWSTVEETSTYKNVCVVCRQQNTFILNELDFLHWKLKGEYVQDVFPYLFPANRELLISGTHAECWKTLYPPEEE